MCTRTRKGVHAVCSPFTVQFNERQLEPVFLSQSILDLEKREPVTHDTAVIVTDAAMWTALIGGRSTEVTFKISCVTLPELLRVPVRSNVALEGALRLLLVARTVGVEPLVQLDLKVSVLYRGDGVVDELMWQQALFLGA